MGGLSQSFQTSQPLKKEGSSSGTHACGDIKHLPDLIKGPLSAAGFE